MLSNCPPDPLAFLRQKIGLKMDQKSICYKHTSNSLYLVSSQKAISKKGSKKWTEKWTKKINVIESPPSVWFYEKHCEGTFGKGEVIRKVSASVQNEDARNSQFRASGPTIRPERERLRAIMQSALLPSSYSSPSSSVRAPTRSNNSLRRRATVDMRKREK